MVSWRWESNTFPTVWFCRSGFENHRSRPCPEMVVKMTISGSPWSLQHDANITFRSRDIYLCVHTHKIQTSSVTCRNIKAVSSQPQNQPRQLPSIWSWFRVNVIIWHRSDLGPGEDVKMTSGLITMTPWRHQDSDWWEPPYSMMLIKREERLLVINYWE